MNLKNTLLKLSGVIFTEFMPISQFLLLKEPVYSNGAAAIKRIAAISETDRKYCVGQFKEILRELQVLSHGNHIIEHPNEEERVIIRETVIALETIIKDDELGWYPYLSENFLTGVHSGGWLYAVLEDKIVAGLGGKDSEKAKATLLNVLEVTPAWQKDTIEAWKEGMKRGLVMSQGAVEQTVEDLKERFLDLDFFDVDPNYYRDANLVKKSRYMALANGLDEDDRALSLISDVIKGWTDMISFLLGDYMIVAKATRPYARPGIHLVPNGVALYEHLTRRFVTYDPGSPDQVAALGYRITEDIKREMTALGKDYFGQSSFKQVADLLLDRNSPLTHFQDMTGDAVKGYLHEEAKEIKSVLPKLFTKFPKCDFDIRLFKSAGVAYYVSGRVNHQNDPAANDDPHDEAQKYCVEKGVYYAGVPSLDPKETFSYEKDDLSLLMHESIPGHHFQLQIAIENPNIAAGIVPEGLQMFLTGSQSGFTEGWALYAESLGFSLGLYLPVSNSTTSVTSMSPSPADDKKIKLALRTLRHHNNNLLRSLRLILDSELNTGKRDRASAIDLMVSHGFQPSYAAFEVDRYTAAPGQALGYMLGCQRLLELRKKAEKSENTFHPGTFHDIILRSGTVTLDTVTENVNRHYG